MRVLKPPPDTTLTMWKMMVSSLLIISTVMADLLCAMVPMSFHLSHTHAKCTQGMNFPTQNISYFLPSSCIYVANWVNNHFSNLLVGHDGSAVSVFDKHANEGHTNENVIGVVVLWRKNKHHWYTVRSHYDRDRLLCGCVCVCGRMGVLCNFYTLAAKLSWPKPSSFSTSLM